CARGIIHAHRLQQVVATAAGAAEAARHRADRDAVAAAGALSALTARCVIAGGGPAGMVCGYLLARAGIDVIVLEKHADFFRDFRLLMQTTATSLIEETGEVRGLRAQNPEGELEIRADLVIGADGRHSTIREQAGFVPKEFGSPIDVIWFRLPLKASDPTEPV